MKKVLLATSLVLGMMAGMAEAQEVLCPAAMAPTPAIAMTGPYQIVGYGTKKAKAVRLPNCEVAQQQLDLMVKGAENAQVVSKIIAESDGTYTAQIEAM